MKSRFVTKIILSLPFSAIENVLTVKMDWDSMGFLVGNLSGNRKIRWMILLSLIHRQTWLWRARYKMV
jgi:hypothetical protein